MATGAVGRGRRSCPAGTSPAGAGCRPPSSSPLLEREGLLADLLGDRACELAVRAPPRPTRRRARRRASRSTSRPTSLHDAELADRAAAVPGRRRRPGAADVLARRARASGQPRRRPRRPHPPAREGVRCRRSTASAPATRPPTSSAALPLTEVQLAAVARDRRGRAIRARAARARGGARRGPPARRRRRGRRLRRRRRPATCSSTLGCDRVHGRARSPRPCRATELPGWMAAWDPAPPRRRRRRVTPTARDRQDRRSAGCSPILLGTFGRPRRPR